MKTESFKKSVMATGSFLSEVGTIFIVRPLLWTAFLGQGLKRKIEDIIINARIEKFICLIAKLKLIYEMQKNADTALIYDSGEEVIFSGKSFITMSDKRAKEQESQCFIILDVEELFERIDNLKENFKEREIRIKITKDRIKKENRFMLTDSKNLKAIDMKLSLVSKTDQVGHWIEQFNFLSTHYKTKSLALNDNLTRNLSKAEYMRFWCGLKEKDFQTPFLPLLWSPAKVEPYMIDEIYAQLEKISLDKSVANTLKVNAKTLKYKPKI